MLKDSSSRPSVVPCIGPQKMYILIRGFYGFFSSDTLGKETLTLLSMHSTRKCELSETVVDTIVLCEFKPHCSSFFCHSVIRSTGSFNMAFTMNVAKVIDMNPLPVTFA